MLAGLVPVSGCPEWNEGGAPPAPEAGPQEEHHVPKFLLGDMYENACACLLSRVACVCVCVCVSAC